MKPLLIMTVFGTRPEAIKLAPVIKRLEGDSRFESIPIATAQHREMLDQVLDLFGIQPAEDLNLMTEDQPLAKLTASIFTGLDPLLEKYAPDWLLVQGDTTTAMAAALAAYYRRINVGHVEAGLRTGDKWQPFPEEVNRRVISTLADLHFAPTGWARGNLLKEGVPDERIRVTGNTIIDALHMILKLPPPPELEKLLAKAGILGGKRKLIVVTAHRRENFGQPIRDICLALKELAVKYARWVVMVYPVHMNPHIFGPVHKLLGDVPNIMLLSPLDYLSQVHLMKNAKLILTDSGGIQEEATGLGVPCLVLREVTERPEGVEAGVLNVVGTQKEAIIEETTHILEDESAWKSMARAANPYGDGKAGEAITNHLMG